MPETNDEAENQTQNATEFFRAGVTLLRRGRGREALRALRRARDMAPDEARFLSYYGLCLAVEGGQQREGVRLCRQAAEEEFYRPELHLNLGKALLTVGDAPRAQEAFREGLSLDPLDRAIIRELDRMGVRRRPLFPFLDRRNLCNRWTGLLRHHAGGAGRSSTLAVV